jgi:hypothetical protein
MPDDPHARRTVSPDDLIDLAEIFDRFKFADDPNSLECKEAEIQYYTLVDELYQQCVKPYYQSISLCQFRGKINAECFRLTSRKRRP